ncbi:isocitrate lyase/PEP mutase family protein [Niveispirillum sp. KHB5.9]|uniref:isocitrate lyase/PEP mutase family protein n=1 Tax=Niveispirillum sp. KHB5.9 TaxID=3400269 RepID=UPI003A88719B
MSDNFSTFHTLHTGESPLILCNVWDGGSARMMRSLGAKAIATTSAGLAWALGVADGNKLPAGLLLGAAANIVRIVPDLPVSIDMEAGYSDDPAAVADLARRIVATGVVGVNIEDGAGTPELLAEKIKAIRAAVGPGLFINARTDVYLRGLAPVGERATEVVRRGAIYAAAGASGLFPAGVTDPLEIKHIVTGVNLPLNVMARPGLLPAAELGKLGVKRLSAGSALTEHIWGRVASLAGPFLADGISDPICADAMPYGQVNALMAGGQG